MVLLGGVLRCRRVSGLKCGCGVFILHPGVPLGLRGANSPNFAKFIRYHTPMSTPKNKSYPPLDTDLTSLYL